MPATLSTSEFGRLSGLSAKALRLYDISGLLRADYVDPVSGYRRYNAEQVERARRISLMRRLDMPLNAVTEVLEATDDEALGRLDRWWAGQEATMQSKRASWNWLRGQLSHAAGPADLRYAVGIRTVPATKIATIRTEVDQPGLVEAMRGCEWVIRSHLDDQPAVHTPEHWVIYHGLTAPETEATIEVCVPYKGTVEPAGEITIRVEPEHREVFTTVARDDCFYPRIMRAYEAVTAYSTAHALAPSGPEREVYLDYWDAIAGPDPFVHVAQPIEE